MGLSAGMGPDLVSNPSSPSFRLFLCATPVRSLRLYQEHFSAVLFFFFFFNFIAPTTLKGKQQ